MLITVALIAVALLVEKVDNVHAALFLAAVVAVVAAMLIGFKWSALEKMMINGISRSLQSILILLVIGMMIGVWMYSGVVPAMIYYGLKIMRPAFFLAAVMVICSISSIATGSSWGTAASMGIAFLGISHGLGINPAITAGAVISGAYFGDKMSPLSDTTNLAPAMAGTDVMTHVKFMLIPTGITYIVTLAIFALMPVAANINLFGFHRLFYKGVSAGNMDVANALGNAIKQAFPNINPLLMLPPVVVIVAIALKVPAIPGLTLGLFSGALLGVIFKDGTSFKVLIDTCYGGFGLEKEFVFSGAYNDEVLKTVNAAIKELLGNLDPEAYDTTGGISNMGGTIALIMIAMMYGGVMEGTGMLGKFVEKIKKIVKTPAGLVSVAEGTCIFSNVAMPVRRGLRQDGRLSRGAVQRAGELRHYHLRSGALEHLRCLYGKNLGYQDLGSWWLRPLGDLQLADAGDERHPGLLGRLRCRQERRPPAQEEASCQKGGPCLIPISPENIPGLPVSGGPDFSWERNAISNMQNIYSA